ncbi:MAG: hypothetical protein ACE5FJ_05640 [Gemmatimonadales bacterium]
MTAPVTKASSQSFEDRALALGQFFECAGEAPRLLAYDDEVGCPLHNSLAGLEWARTVGVVFDDDLIHAARLSGESAAVMVERRSEGGRSFVYIGPRMDAPPTEPQDGELLYDQPGVRAFRFGRRSHALAHFLRATEGVGAVVSILSRRAPELRHVRRWLSVYFENPHPQVSSVMVGSWFATSGAGFLFAPVSPADQYHYEELTQQ